MLIYKRISRIIFKDVFCNKEIWKSSWVHTCCLLFVTNKDFYIFLPMKCKGRGGGGVIQSVKPFSKEIGAPDAIICDASGDQKSNNLRKLWRYTGTTLWVLEEGTPWVNKTELYICLIKEAFIKYMKETNCSNDFGDYCVDRRARINSMMEKIYCSSVDPTRILKWLEMKVTFPIYVGKSGMIAVILTISNKHFLWIRGSLVKHLDLR